MTCFTMLRAICSVLIVMVSTASSTNENRDCIIPAEQDLFMLLLDNGGVVLKPSPFLDTQHPDILKGQTMGHSNFTPDDLECPVGKKPPKGAPLNEKASCPWRFVIDHDATRYPVTLSNAVQLCGSCLDAGGSVMPGTRCEPIKYPTKILLQKGCELGGVMQYNVEDIQLIVAFQCVVIDQVPTG